jgi:hypothetical protein
MAYTACLVCLVSTVGGCCKNTLKQSKQAERAVKAASLILKEKNRLLKVCYVLATGTNLPRLLFCCRH